MTSVNLSGHGDPNLGAIMEPKLTTYQQVLSVVYALTIVAAIVVTALDLLIWRK
jgi:hypothetical protein